MIRPHCMGVGCIALSCILITTAELTAAEIQFERIQLSDEFYAEGGTFADYDGDGHGDVAVGPRIYFGPDYMRTTSFYEGEPFNPVGYSQNFLMYSDDVNGDGAVDILVLGFPGRESWWYENPGKEKLAGESGVWTEHIIIDSVDNESPLIADINADGVKDLICSTGGHYIFASHAGQAATEKWQITKVSPNNGYQRFTHGIGIGDVNNDSHQDLIEKNGWWENPGEASKTADEPWTFHEYKFADEGAQMYAVDFDGDGRNEVLSSVHAHGFGLIYHKATNEEATQFEKIEIMTDDPATSPVGIAVSQLHAVDLADVNQDGVMDIVTGKRWWAHKNKDAGHHLPATLVWFETQRSGGRVKFIPHVIDNSSGVGTQVTAGDVNGDGLVDIVSGNKRGAYLFLQRPASIDVAKSLVPEQAELDRFGQLLATEKVASDGAVLPALKGRALNLGFDADELIDWEVRGPIAGTAIKQLVDTGAAGPKGIGEVISRPFVIPAGKFQFVAGGKPDATAYVELLLRSSGKSIVTWKKASGEDTMAEQSYNVSQHVGQVARIRIVDHSETGHVKADSFHFRN
ncbi:MAG: hypothetical protein Aurels2KO_05310 [Aureliella sp.]